MTASPAQLAANLANAALSTGPRSDDGKATAARNALDHGAYASDHTLSADPTSTLPTLLQTFNAEFDPQSPTETFLVRRLALLAARMDRLAAALDALDALGERRALVDCLQETYDVAGPSATLMDQPGWAAALRRYDGSLASYPRDPDPSRDPDLAQATIAFTESSPRAALLYRADTAADRRFQATLRQLLALQAARRGPAPDPVS